jgi:hypothetical protein
MRKHLAVSAFIFATLLLAGCGSKISLPPVTPDEVEVITEEPQEEFRKIADIRQMGKMDTPRRDLIAGAREKAANLGADALWIKEYRLSQSSQNPTITLLAVAIVYPARHPDAESN